MKVSLSHNEKQTGMIRKTTHHGVTVHVQFDASETAIIQERKLEKTIVVERDPGSDVDVEKLANRGVGMSIATGLVKAATQGMDSLNFDLTIATLLRGPDTYFLSTPLEAKEYEGRLREQLPVLKDYILGNEAVEQQSDSFEL